MIRKYNPIILALILLVAVTGCIGSKFGSATKGEKVYMTAPPKRDVINYTLLKKQQSQPLTLANRGEINRGVESAFVGSLVSFGVTAVKQVIANEDKKYTTQWKQGLNDLYFYDQPSAEGPFDPTGMQFNGFTITRTFKDLGETKTAISADFEIDKDSVPANEIINDAIFRLKLKDIKVMYSKSKIPVGRDTINIDFDIVFTTSYISKEGQLYKDVEIGRFALNLRKIPLDSNARGYKEYFARLRNKKLEGKGFLVPRSYGHYKTTDNNIIALYNQGLFNVCVNVKESSKNDFINEMLIQSSQAGMDEVKGMIMRNIPK